MFSSTRTDNESDSQSSLGDSSLSRTSRVPSEPSIVNAELRVKGDLESSGDIQVYGQVDGDITSRSVTICPGARVTGSLKADSIRISGNLEGQIEAPSVTIEKGAKVKGDIIHESLAVESGAEIEGHCRRLNKASAKPAARSEKPEPAPTKSFDTLDLKKEDGVEGGDTNPFKPAGAAS